MDDMMDPVNMLRWLRSDVLTDDQLMRRVPGTGYRIQEYPIPFKIGERVEIPVHHDMWARGARFGTIKGYYRSSGTRAEHYTVKLDHPGAKLHRVYTTDWAYMKPLRRT